MGCRPDSLVKYKPRVAGADSLADIFKSLTGPSDIGKMTCCKSFESNHRQLRRNRVFESKELSRHLAHEASLRMVP